MRKILSALTVAALAIPVGLSAPAQAGYYDHHYHGHGRYNGPMWRGHDGHYHCRRSDGTTGLIIGAAGGALLGRAVDTHGERTTGTLLGAAAGGLLGRSIDRNNVSCH